MGINDILPHLPGGGKHDYKHSFYGAIAKGTAVPLDAASALWQFAAYHGWDYLSGNCMPALMMWARFLIYLRDICEWKLYVFMDGRVNAEKLPEIERRREAAERAEEHHQLFGQIRITPEYIAMAVHVCNFLTINVYVSAYEADPQVAYIAMELGVTPMSGDSDLLAYGVPGRLLIVKAFRTDWFRMIDLEAAVDPGKYPILDLYKTHGKIVFQLYAGVSGCDFTKYRSGIKGIGFAAFVELASVEGELNSATLAKRIWTNVTAKAHAEKAELMSEEAVREHLQHVIDVYAQGKLYDRSNSNIINMSGEVIEEATSQLKRHMNGKLNSKTMAEIDEGLQTMINRMRVNELIHKTAADASTIRGVQLPAGKTPQQCTVTTLRDFVACRGGPVSMNKPDLVEVVKTFQFLEKEAPKRYVDRNPDRNGSLFQKIDTSGTRRVKEILDELAAKATTNFADVSDTRALIIETQKLYEQGLFDHSYDNIARFAPELKDGFIYKSFGHIGSSITEKCIGDALARCWYEKEMTYHAVALVPGTNKCIILSKAHASMHKDEKTRSQTEEGEAPKKQEYLLIMELTYVETSAEDGDAHSLGIFVELGRTYCTLCIGGQGDCRHRPERLWYQFFHWTPERLGIDVPPTMNNCSWHPGGRVLGSDVRMKIHEQQAVKHERSIKAQAEKMKRGQKRDCTEGICGDYQVHLSSAKQGKHPGRFTPARTKKLFDLLRSQSKK